MSRAALVCQFIVRSTNLWHDILNHCYCSAQIDSLRIIVVDMKVRSDAPTSSQPTCVYKWKNHFYEMKGDVGMSLHEKGRNKKMPTPRHEVTHNPIPTSLFLPRLQHNIFRRQLDIKMLCCFLCLITNKQTNNMLQQNKDVGMGL